MDFWYKIRNRIGCLRRTAAGKTIQKMALDKEQTDQAIEQIIEVLHTIYDPEIPVDIYELGLIYDISVSPEGKAKILMTFTAPNCPIADSMPEEMKEKIVAIVGQVSEVEIEITFDPQWTIDMMSEEARLELGFM